MFFLMLAPYEQVTSPLVADHEHSTPVNAQICTQSNLEAEKLKLEEEIRNLKWQKDVLNLELAQGRQVSQQDQVFQSILGAFLVVPLAVILFRGLICVEQLMGLVLWWIVSMRNLNTSPLKSMVSLRCNLVWYG